MFASVKTKKVYNIEMQIITDIKNSNSNNWYKLIYLRKINIDTLI